MSLAAFGIAATMVAAAQTPARPQAPSRDTSAQPRPAPVAGKGRISGRVLAADNARPVRRARVFISAQELAGGRGLLTNDDGLFDFTELPAGRYTLTVSKTGYINLSYGQRRPLQAGTPLQLAEAQQLTGIEFRLPRGSAITGHIYDETGDPLAGATVRVMRYQYAQGNRQLVPAGMAQTDDLGAYRVWGLNPGEYYVSAMSRNFDLGGRGGPGPAAIAAGMPLPPGVGPGGGRGGRGGRGPGAVGDAVAQALELRGAAAQPFEIDADAVGYAPTFYPGAPSVNEAQAVTVGLGAEASAIDFAVLLVRTATISGRVSRQDGVPTARANVQLMAENGVGRGGPGGNFGGRVLRDGTFSIANVPPGRYTIRARGDDNDAPVFAMQPLVVADADVRDISLVLSPGGTISGTVSFQATQSATTPNPNQVRIAAPPIDFANMGPNPIARLERDGTFTMDGVSAGLHWIRSQGAPRGWMLKSVLVSGRDLIDTPLEMKSGQTISGVNLIFTDRLTEINGTVTDAGGVPITDYTVLAFPTDTTYWRPQARQIMTARPDQNGKYQIRGLPPGDYLLATVDPTEQGEWFEPAFLEEHRNGASRLTLSEGDVKSHDFSLTNR